MLNNISLVGRLCAAPEVRTIAKDNIPVLNFCVAVEANYTTGDGERPCYFIDCVAWRGQAEFIGKWFGKGDPIAVSGELTTRMWEDDDGGKHKATEVAVTGVYFAGAKSEAKSTGKGGKGGKDKATEVAITGKGDKGGKGRWY